MPEAREARPIILEPFNGGLAAARALVRSGTRPVLVLTSALAWMGRTRGVDVVRTREDTDDGILDALRELAEQGPAVVVTGADRSTELLARRRDELPGTLMTFEGPGSAHLDLIGKDRAYEIAREAGVAVPWSQTVESLAELPAAVAEAPYPAIVKPELSHEYRRLFGDQRVFVVNDAAEAERAASPALAEGIAMMISELVPGGDDDVEEAIVVRAADGSYPVRFGCRKLRQYPRGFGAASLAVSDPIPESMELAEAVLDRAGFVGVVGVETKRHPQNGRRYFLEANVRLPTQWALGDASGIEASRRLIAAAAGETLPPQPPFVAGAKFMFPELEARAALEILRETRGAALPRLVREWRGTRELGLLDPRDLGPAAGRFSQVVRKRVRARGRRGPA